ncbi:uncharacterized protein ACNS7B_001636 [Menidia menidia]
MCSPAEGMCEVSGDDLSGDGDDKDYTPSSRVRTGGAIQTRTSLNADQSLSREDTAHAAADGQTLIRSEDATEHLHHYAQEKLSEEPIESQGPWTSKNGYACPTCGKVFSQN